MTIEEILSAERLLLGRDVELIDSAELAEDVRAVVYRAFVPSFRQTQIRVATYAGDHHVSSGLARVEYAPAGKADSPPE